MNAAAYVETNVAQRLDRLPWSPKPSYYFSCLAVALAIASAAPLWASEQIQPKHAGNIKKRQAGQIALGKVHGGTIRAAELLTSNGGRFWSVYVVRSGSMNAKEVHVDAASGKVLAVQTERPADQAEEPTGRD